ncbi:hypothetical protein ILUMI_23502 [Ignelater luminosus]|uniref:Peptidase S1 domain-containing protein n=1 Tax=Ignelater luminosus TaxID=2038154 RepID=A0A8K0C8P3_IGNLU|nr:hypothetical protein ILUMI_23502 [Ignelater luminosus]
MLGYPPRCEKRGISHACTLAFACWWVGGSSQTGCGTSPWIVACCVKAHPTREVLHPNYDLIYEEHYQRLETPEREMQVLQKRNDEIEEECGVSPSRIMQKRIIGGDMATFAQFPWQAHLKISTYQCGGVLVSQRYVATAAHCIIRARLKDIVVYLGELDTQNTGKVLELAPSERHGVRQKIIHPKFKFRTTQPDRYDIALLELNRRAGQSFHILPICLPEVGIKLEGRNAVVAGWGKTKPSTDLTGTNVLRSATVPILDIKECMSWHRIKQITVELYEEMLCAGHKDGHKDACLGDSGGPLIILVNGRWTLILLKVESWDCTFTSALLTSHQNKQ